MDDKQFREFMHVMYKIRDAACWAAVGVYLVAVWTAALAGLST